MSNELPSLENCQKLYEQLWEKFNTSVEELITFLLRYPVAQVIAGVRDGELPEGAPVFELDDIQKKHFEEAKKLYDKLKTQIDAQVLESEEEYRQFIEEQEQEEREKAKSRRLEYYTKNDDLTKLPLPDNTLHNLFMEIEKNDHCPDISERHIVAVKDDIRDKMHDVIYNDYEKHMNERFASVILPYLTYVLSGECKYDLVTLSDEEGNKTTKIAMTEVPYLLSHYECVADFLLEYNGIVYENADDEVSYGVFEETLFDMIFDYTEQFIHDAFFNIAENELNLTIAEDRKEDVYSAMITYLFPYDCISTLVNTYVEIIKNLSIKELFDLYDLKDQKDNYEYCLLDEHDFNNEKEQIREFINSLKTSTPKEITIFSGQMKYRFLVDSNNNLLNENGEDIEKDVQDLLWEMGTDLEQNATLFVHETTSIKNKNNEAQQKVSGIVIQEGIFYAITKESLKDVFQQIEEQEYEKNYRYFDWSFNYLPNLNINSDEEEDQ